MTLRTRIVAALVLAALIPMAVVLAVPLAQAERRAHEETARRLTQADKQLRILVEIERAATRAAADRAASALKDDRAAQSAVVRASESVADPVAARLAQRGGLDRVEVRTASGTVLSAFAREEEPADAVLLTERRNIAGETEILTIVASRTLGPEFVTRLAAVAGGDAHLGGRPAGCRPPFAEVPVDGAAVVCVEVTPADAGDVRRDLLRSFAGVATAALVTTIALGMVLASRITRPVRELAERAESISAQRSRPITLLPEKDETRRMTIAFDQMLDALQASERQRLAAERIAAWEEIAKRLAHEIKNPLSPIQLAVENLERTRQLAPEQFDQAFAVETRTIKEEVGALRRLVDEFAQFARLPRPRVAPCDPKAILGQALALYAGRIESMQVSVAVDDTNAPSTLKADAEQLGRVLKNVITNALDAMEDAPSRRLSVAVRRDGDEVVFSVRDTGRGFDAEALRRVFEPYFTTRAGRGGTGLGMAIARRIALEHGGSLDAEGSPGRGAKVTLTVPLEGPVEAV